MARLWVNLGPQHPLTHGCWNLRVELEGETIVSVDPELGYLHRGMEKLCEDRLYNQISTQTDRLCYASSATWTHAYHLAVEELMGVEVPERAEYIRTIALETQRIISHLLWIAAYMPDLGFLTMFLYAMREREFFIDLMQSVSGARLTYNFTRVGGVSNDLPPNFENQTRKVIGHFRKKLREYETLCDESPIFRMRTMDVGTLSREDSMKWGISGPNCRASGVDYDVRRDDPYSIYPELRDWQVAREVDGDSYARHRVRMAEMEESCNIIEEALDRMPTLRHDGDILAKVPRNVPEGTAFRRAEDSRGEAMFYIVSDGTDKPYRLKIKSPVFVSIAASPVYLTGYKLADAPAIMGSMDVCLGETDR